MQDASFIDRKHRSEYGTWEKVERLGAAAVAYIRARSKEEWLIFLAGLMLGLLLG